VGEVDRQVDLYANDQQPPPLADRMRPGTLDEILGQEHLVGPDGVIRAFVERRELPSMIFWGPPGSGKTTMARLLADASGTEMVTFSAVLSGVKEARAIMAEASRRRKLEGRRTVLFVDEIHRFNRAQQDAFLPFVEVGDIVLVGATTENPSFELNRALLSRVKVYILEPLEEDDMARLLDRAMRDHDRGLGASGVDADAAALGMIGRLAAGDARQALNHLELAVSLAGVDGVTCIDETLVQRIAQRSVAVYDKGREEHYNLISALHKSVRNSDVDASLYWLGRMLEGGADPRFVVRRLLRMASEDIGMADPKALEQVSAAAHAVEHMGMPECELALAQATAYLALAQKSNAIYKAYGAVKREVSNRPGLAIPMAIRNAPTALMKDVGYGKGYRYAHDEVSGVSEMQCLPDEIKTATFYRPTERGWEHRIGERLKEIAALKKRS